MFDVNDMVLYGNQGVCCIDEISSREFKGEKVDYYVLQSVYHKGAKVYVPKDNESLTEKMKRILSLDEINSLIKEMPGIQTNWIDNDNQRREAFKLILRSGNRSDIAGMIRTLYLRQTDLKSKGKKLHAADDGIFKEAEKLLYEEFAYVLNINQEDVLPYISKQIG